MTLPHHLAETKGRQAVDTMDTTDKAAWAVSGLDSEHSRSSDQALCTSQLHSVNACAVVT
ncbi:hypothetical protein J6590_070613 [Homalodisca vitripennis]|nr:hypothetical protein J6590_070613 [Homalodisca vitripennis]